MQLFYFKKYDSIGVKPWNLTTSLSRICIYTGATSRKNRALFKVKSQEKTRQVREKGLNNGNISKSQKAGRIQVSRGVSVPLSHAYPLQMLNGDYS